MKDGDELKEVLVSYEVQSEKIVDLQGSSQSCLLFKRGTESHNLTTYRFVQNSRSIPLFDCSPRFISDGCH